MVKRRPSPLSLKALAKHAAFYLARPNTVAVKSAGLTELVPEAEILYAERLNRKTRLVCEHGERWTYESPAKLFAKLPEGSFIRCHQSFWVNAWKITAMEKGEFVLSNGSRITISRTHGAEARALFFRGLGRGRPK